MKRQVRDGYDHDANCRRCRRYLTALQRAGVRAYAKRKARRRERREGKADLRRRDD